MKVWKVVNNTVKPIRAGKENDASKYGDLLNENLNGNKIYVWKAESFTVIIAFSKVINNTLDLIVLDGKIKR